MTVLWRITLLALVFAGSMSGRPNASPQATSTSTVPTLKETADWLVSHLVTVDHSSRETVVTFRAKKKGQEPKEVDRQITNTRESISAATFQRCSLTLTQTIKGDDYTYITVSTIPLDRMIDASWQMEKRDSSKTADGLDSTETTIVPASFAAVTLQAATKAITFKKRSSGSVPLALDLMPYEGTASSLVFTSDDAEMPQRLVNAFNHAIQLCHVDAKPEPF